MDKSKYHFYLTFIIKSFVISHLFAQNDFQVAVDFPMQLEDAFRCTGIAEWKNDQLVALLYLSPATPSELEPVFWLNLDHTGSVISAKRLYEQTQTHIWEPDWNSLEKWNDISIFPTMHNIQHEANSELTDMKSIVFLNTRQSTAIAKNVFVQTNEDDSPIVNSLGLLRQQNKVVFSRKRFPDTIRSSSFIGLSCFDLQHNRTAWDYAYFNGNPSNNAYKMAQLDITVTDRGKIIALAEQQFPFSKRSVIASFDENGHVLQVIRLADSLSVFHMATDANENLYLSGLFTSSGAHFIVKLSPELEPVWSKLINIEDTSIGLGYIQVEENQNLFFTLVAANSSGLFATILHHFNLGGELLSQQAVHNDVVTAASNIDSQGRWCLATKSNTSIFPNRDEMPVVGRTDTDFNLSDCPQYPVCPQISDIIIEVEPWTLHRIPLDTLPNFPMVVEDIPALTVPYCNVPPPPSADFVIPDTICQYDCVIPDELNNSRIPIVNWHLKGPELDTLIQAPAFEYCFATPGTFQIRQEFQLLGCTYIHYDSVYVLPDNLAPDLGADTLHCTDEPVLMRANASRPVHNWHWSTGDTTATIVITQSGQYSLTVNDGYCEASNSVAHNFISERYPAPQIVIDTPSVEVCPDLLPYSLRPHSAYGDLFSLVSDTVRSDVLPITVAGNWQIAIDLEGCLYTTDFELALVNCEVPIYLPTAFSPNRDGVNDTFFPQGADFMPLRLRVYNRWGSLLLDQQTTPYAWDGNSQDEPVTQGVYLVQFSYQNLRTNKLEEMTQEVTLLR